LTKSFVESNQQDLTLIGWLLTAPLDQVVAVLMVVVEELAQLLVQVVVELAQLLVQVVVELARELAARALVVVLMFRRVLVEELVRELAKELVKELVKELAPLLMAELREEWALPLVEELAPPLVEMELELVLVVVFEALSLADILVVGYTHTIHQSAGSSMPAFQKLSRNGKLFCGESYETIIFVGLVLQVASFDNRKPAQAAAQKVLMELSVLFCVVRKILL
jgi:hypothetical protein